MNEFDLIAELRRIFETEGYPGITAVDLNGGNVVVPNGDDAAVIRLPGGLATITTDALVECVHFNFQICSPADIGYRSIAVNLSDLAAMGARPVGLLVSFVVPDSVDDVTLTDIAGGIAEASLQFAVPVVGGNVTRTDGPLVISITALGDQVVLPAPCRKAALPGDEVWVSGFTGDGAAGLKLLLENRELEPSFPGLVGAFRRPCPRLDLTDLMLRTSVHAAIDISDGFVADLGHVACDSGVMATVDIDKLPLSSEAIDYCAATGRSDMIATALYGGDDYQLILVAPPESHDAMVAADMHLVGSIAAGNGVVLLSGGRCVEPDVKTGWLHRQ